MCKYKEEMPDVRCRMSDFYFFEVEDFFNVHFLYRIIRDPSLPKYKRFVETPTLAEETRTLAEPWLRRHEPWLKCSNIHLLKTSENAVHRGIYSMNTPENGMYRGVYFMKTSEKEMIFEESQMNTFENQLFITNCLFNEPLLSLHSPIM